MPFLTRKRTILIKTEVTYGTDAVPTGATDALTVRSIDVSPIDADLVSRDLIRPYLGNSPQLLTNLKVQCNFEVELAGSGTAGSATGPRWAPAMLACGTQMVTSTGISNTFNPVSASFQSATIYYFADGIRHAVTGWRGTFEIRGEVGQIPVIAFSGTGVYNAPTDTAVGAVTFGGQADPLTFTNGNTTAFSLFSYSGCLSSFSFAMNNEIVYRELIGCTKEILITDRKPAGQVMIESVPIATKDYFTAANNSATGNLTFTHGTTAGNRVVFTAAQVDLTNPTYGDSDGVMMLNLPYVALPTTAGNNEFSLALT
jgi:hypothetical protein